MTDHLVDFQLHLLLTIAKAAGSDLRTLGIQHHTTHVGKAVDKLSVGMVDTEALVQVANAQISLLVSLKRCRVSLRNSHEHCTVYNTRDIPREKS